MEIETIQMLRDGNLWCALIGPNLQEGIAGFGDTHEEAIATLRVEYEIERGGPLGEFEVTAVAPR